MPKAPRDRLERMGSSTRKPCGGGQGKEGRWGAVRGETAQSRGCVHGTPLSSGCCLQQLLRHQHTCFTMARSWCLHAPLHWPAGGGRHLEVDNHEEDGHRGQQLDDVGQALAVEGVLHCEGSGRARRGWAGDLWAGRDQRTACCGQSCWPTLLARQAARHPAPCTPPCLKGLGFVSAGEQEVDQRDDGTLKLGATAHVQGVGAAERESRTLQLSCTNGKPACFDCTNPG